MKAADIRQSARNTIRVAKMISKTSPIHKVGHPGRNDLRIAFVHTPMAALKVEGRDMFWKNLDRLYYAVHPQAKPMDESIWEIPHWMTWLAGVARDRGFDNLMPLNLQAAADANLGIDRHAFEREIRATSADVYLFSPMTANLHFALTMASIIKRVYPKAKTIFGGIVATPMHRTLAREPVVDFVVHGRGELALPDLLEAIDGRRDIGTVGNLTFREENGQVTENLQVYPWVQAADIPYPAVDLFPQELGSFLRYIRINYALGCPFKCSFCTIQTIGQKPDYFPIDRVLQEIRDYQNHYGRDLHIYFGDETFTHNTRATLALCERLNDEGITYDIQTRLTSARNRRVLAALKKSGCAWVEVGIEAVSQKSMNLHKQGTDVGMLEDTLRRIRDAGLPACSFIINGLPGLSLDDMRRSIDSTCNLLSRDLLHASYFLGLVPYPGSKMYDNPLKYGIKLRHRKFELYNEEALPVYDTDHASAEQIYGVFLEGVQEIGQAMDKPPFLGQVRHDLELRLGKSLTHV